MLMAILFAGCLGQDPPETIGAKPAYDAAAEDADEKFAYSLFLGITGTEGPLDWNRYESVLANASTTGAQLADGLNQNVPNGAFGDGKLGAWLSTHFAYDEDNYLVGSQFTQVLADGTQTHVFTPFTGPYAGTTALPNMIQNQHKTTQSTLQFPTPWAAAQPTLDAVADHLNQWQLRGTDSEDEIPKGETVLCALRTHTDQWSLSSADAARVALGDPVFRQHMDELKGGELSYYYFPSLAVEEACPAELDVLDNFWAISYTDLDTFLDPKVASPPLYTLIIDAETGKILEKRVLPLVLQPPTILDSEISIEDPLVPTTHKQTHFIEFQVDPNASALELRVTRPQYPTLMLNPDTRLRDPDGRIVEGRSMGQNLHLFDVDAPDPGTWKIEYRYQSLTSQGQHQLALQGIVSYH